MPHTPPEVSATGRVLKEHSHSQLNLAKLVELRKRSRVERARQLASNIDTQAHIQKSIEHYNLEAARLQLSNALGGMGRNVPQAARVVHEARLDELGRKLATLEQERTATAPRRAIPGFRRLGRPADQMTLDAFGRRY